MAGFRAQLDWLQARCDVIDGAAFVSTKTGFSTMATSSVSLDSTATFAASSALVMPSGIPPAACHACASS